MASTVGSGPSSPAPSPPLSPSSSSYSIAPFSAPSRPPLPVAALRDRIVEKIKENRVTLIVGDTGCGKSSQVPQYLLEENMEPILCTQPRRFAVVAIARMVAKARDCEVGGEVGYHIGHSNVTSTSSRIVFKTAGVLLEQMRDKGLAALNYKVIILDEVHERSVESDLVLACIKQFMTRKTNLRLVLMSATADISRYRDYFRDLSKGERVEVLAIASTTKQTIFQRKTLYLEQVSELLGKNLGSPLFEHHSGLSPFTADAEMNPEVHNLIHKLVLHVHDNEPDIEKSILVFLPTYYSLEQQWTLLKPYFYIFKVHILHGSIDTEQALSAMRVWKSHRKVILATNIAESSVTIPGVAFVIDSCRSLQVFWDANRRVDATELVWVSKSQAEQRKGRTGRTCDGQIFRLVTGSFYNSLNDHEYPAILRLSLRQQVLMICCAESKAINDPKVLLQKVMDPPDPELIEDALNLLVKMQALEKLTSHRGRCEPTFYGQLVDSLPLSFDASVLLLQFGEIGLLREGILIAILMDIQPLPILRPFGQQELYSQYLENYFEDDKGMGKKEIVLMGNLCAFQFWEHIFKDKNRLDQLKQIISINESTLSSSLIFKLEEEWCNLHNLVPTALHNISEIYDDVLSVIHRFRPKFLQTANNLPSYYEPHEFRHTCLLHAEPEQVDAVNEDPEVAMAKLKCMSVPFVCSKDLKASNVAEKLAKVIKEIRGQSTESICQNLDQTAQDINGSEAAICKFFVLGACSRGNQCFFSHSLQAKRPQCKFFFTLQGCRNGGSCYYLHDHVPRLSAYSTLSVCLPEDEIASPDTFIQLLTVNDDGCVLILNDKDLRFTSKLSEYLDPNKIFVTRQQCESSESHASFIGVTELLTGSQPWYSIIESNGKVLIPWMKVQSVLWFSDFEANEAEIRHLHLRKFFELLAIRVLADRLHDVRVIITMNNISFSQLQVERLARECFFFLTKSFPFNASTFGGISDALEATRTMQASFPVSYVFSMPPTIGVLGDNSSCLGSGFPKVKNV